jgi:hypothetical protein
MIKSPKINICMNKPNWKELDFKIASDYTHGSPEYYREKLRGMLGLPKLLPGEKDAITQKRDNKNNSIGLPRRRNL